jgi:hypothetical protein
LKKSRVPVAPSRDKHPVPRHGAIIRQPLAAKRRERAARFVHQKVGRRKIPVVTAAAGDGGVNGSFGDAGKPQSQRVDPWHDGEWRSD